MTGVIWGGYSRIGECFYRIECIDFVEDASEFCISQLIRSLYPESIHNMCQWSCHYNDAPKMVLHYFHWASSQWASCQIRKIAGAHAPGMPGTFSPSPQVSDPDMHHGTCVTHVPWCMPGSLTSSFLWNRRRGKTFPAFPAHAQPAILRIW